MVVRFFLKQPRTFVGTRVPGERAPPVMRTLPQANTDGRSMLRPYNALGRPVAEN